MGKSGSSVLNNSAQERTQLFLSQLDLNRKENDTRREGNKRKFRLKRSPENPERAFCSNQDRTVSSHDNRHQNPFQHILHRRASTIKQMRIDNIQIVRSKKQAESRILHDYKRTSMDFISDLWGSPSRALRLDLGFVTVLTSQEFAWQPPAPLAPFFVPQLLSLLKTGLHCPQKTPSIE